MWEITGAEFTNQGVHTADGISIRFPRVTRIRDDKTWKTATNLHELRALFKNSAESIDYSLLLGPDAKKRPKSEGQDSSEPKAKKSKNSEGNGTSEPKAKKSKKPEKLDDTMEVDESSEEQESSKRKPKESKKDSPEKANGSSSDSDKKSRAKYYSFIGTDVSIDVNFAKSKSTRSIGGEFDYLRYSTSSSAGPEAL